MSDTLLSFANLLEDPEVQASLLVGPSERIDLAQEIRKVIVERDLARDEANSLKRAVLTVVPQIKGLLEKGLEGFVKVGIVGEAFSGLYATVGNGVLRLLGMLEFAIRSGYDPAKDRFRGQPFDPDGEYKLERE
jgi:hypothetical protein